MSETSDVRKDFFISYTSTDQHWAEWIAFELEAATYQVIIQAWDFRPGSNFVAEMDNATTRADRILLVLSTAYLTSDYGFAEWAVAFRHDPKGKDGRILPVRVQHCEIEGLLGPIVYIDLMDLDESDARERLLTGVARGRAKPASVSYPASWFSSVLLDRPTFPRALPPIWNVPYPQNPFFTGRENLLFQLAKALHAGQPTALSQLQAISGLGGIGKTQIALEYAYRSRHEYHAILWAQADTREALISSYLSIAALLDLPEKDAQESPRVITVVKNWFQRNTGWLLILDNADDLTIARDFLPPTVSGHVLLTSRAQATGRFAHRLDVETLSTEQSTLFLLRRAGLLASDATLEQVPEYERDLAYAISEDLGGLPLALDQAGAYIEEIGCSLAQYQHLFHNRRNDLLAERRGHLVDDHPLPVTSTWSLSFEHVEQKNPAAADLLRLCAFLAPDAIPETIITQGAQYLGTKLALASADSYLLNQTVEALRTYSLIHREVGNDAVPLLSLHRLVQAVLKDQMDEPSRIQWALNTVQAVNATLPVVEHRTWLQWERILMHTLVCVELIEQYHFYSTEAAHLLQQTGWYLTERVRYTEADTLLKQALFITEQERGLEHLETARDSSTLAYLYHNQGKYVEAEPLYQRALLIREQQLGPDHSTTARSLNNLALLYHEQEKYAEAEPLYQRALLIREQQLGPDHLTTAASLNNLAGLYAEQRKYIEAEPLYQRALLIREQQLGSQHPYTAQSLNNIALLYRNQGKYTEAELLLKRALLIREQQLGTENPATARSLNNLAELYQAQEKYVEAEPLLKRALLIREQQLGSQHPYTAQSFSNLALLYKTQGKYAEAEPLYRHALLIYEQQLGTKHPFTARVLNNLAELYQAQEKYVEAELLYQQALAIYEQQLGTTHSSTQTVRANYVSLLRATGHDEKVNALEQGHDHP